MPSPTASDKRFACLSIQLMNKRIRTALISVFYKDGLEPIVRLLSDLGVTIYSTGGTQKFIEELVRKDSLGGTKVILSCLDVTLEVKPKEVEAELDTP